MEELTLLQRVAVWVIPVLFAITVHETAHGWMASRLGDPTAKMLGRLTLNPVKHIDPFGTILLPALLLLFTNFLFGWAKPVPVTYENLKKPKRDMALVAMAGPLANLLMALFWAMLIRIAMLFGGLGDGVVHFILYAGVAGIFVNVLLMLFNLIPFPPLDGGRVAAGLLPGPLSWKFSQLEPYGLPVLLILMLSGVLGKILIPVLVLVSSLFAAIAGLSEGGFILLLNSLF